MLVYSVPDKNLKKLQHKLPAEKRQAARAKIASFWQ